MEPPFPSPALMLPAIDLSGPPDLDSHLNYKRREAKWKQVCSATHKEWCLCGSYLNHFRESTEPLTNSSCGPEDGGDAGEGATLGGGDISCVGGGGEERWA